MSVDATSAPGTADGQLARWDATEEQWVPIEKVTYHEAPSGSPGLTIDAGSVKLSMVAAADIGNEVLMGIGTVDDLATEHLTGLVAWPEGWKLLIAGDRSLEGNYDGVRVWTPLRPQGDVIFGDGPILISPTSKGFRLTVTDDGDLGTEEVAAVP